MLATVHHERLRLSAWHARMTSSEVLIASGACQLARRDWRGRGRHSLGSIGDCSAVMIAERSADRRRAMERKALPRCPLVDATSPTQPPRHHPATLGLPRRAAPPQTLTTSVVEHLAERRAHAEATRLLSVDSVHACGVSRVPASLTPRKRARPLAPAHSLWYANSPNAHVK
jgi:hypothetical protein